MKSENDGLYSLAFVGFAFGGLVLIGNFTGNVIGFGDSGGIVGVSLIVFGLVLALLLSRWRKATF
jgi:hypothetical protein